MVCMWKGIWVSFLVLLCGITASAEGEPEQLYARSAVLMDADSGRVLFEKDGYKKYPMASTTKIMTCILALEEGDMNDIVTASANAVKQPKVHLGARKGEKFRFGDLLYSLMLESHNDSAVMIAEHLEGTTEKFAEKMNQKAIELGCEDTYFITPNGLDATDEQGVHSTTAADLATIMSYCIQKSEKREAFREITGTKNYQFSNVDGTEKYSCVNHNAFLNMMEGAFSGKTGFTGEAGYCYVGALKRDDRTFVVALLGCGWPNNRTYKWSDAKRLMQYGLENYTYRTINTEISLPYVKVKNGIPGKGKLWDKAKLKLTIDKEERLRGPVLLKEGEEIHVQTDCEVSMQAPVEIGDEVGEISFYVDGELLNKYKIISAERVDKRTLKWCFLKLTEEYIDL